MKRKFSTSWNSSKQPRKQRKYLANAPIHIKRRFISANLSKELRKKHGMRSIPLRTNDVVKVSRGKFKNKTGKIVRIRIQLQKIEVEGMQIRKQDGSKVNVSLRPSNLQIIELNLEDKKRNKLLKKTDEIKKEKPKVQTIKKEVEKKI